MLNGVTDHAEESHHLSSKLHQNPPRFSPTMLSKFERNSYGKWKAHHTCLAYGFSELDRPCSFNIIFMCLIFRYSSLCRLLYYFKTKKTFTLRNPQTVLTLGSAQDLCKNVFVAVQWVACEPLCLGWKLRKETVEVWGQGQLGLRKLFSNLGPRWLNLTGTHC